MLWDKLEEETKRQGHCLLSLCKFGETSHLAYHAQRKEMQWDSGNYNRKRMISSVVNFREKRLQKRVFWKWQLHTWQKELIMALKLLPEVTEGLFGTEVQVNSTFQPQPLWSLSLFAMFSSNELLSYMLAFWRQKSLCSYWPLLYSSIDNHIISNSFSPLSEKIFSILFNYPPQFSIYLSYSQLQEIYITSTKLIIEFSSGPYILKGEYCVQILALLKRDVIWHRWLKILFCT